MKELNDLLAQLVIGELSPQGGDVSTATPIEIVDLGCGADLCTTRALAEAISESEPLPFVTVHAVDTCEIPPLSSDDRRLPPPPPPPPSSASSTSSPGFSVALWPRTRADAVPLADGAAAAIVAQGLLHHLEPGCALDTVGNEANVARTSPSHNADPAACAKEGKEVSPGSPEPAKNRDAPCTRRSVVAECVRLLRPGGVAALAVWSRAAECPALSIPVACAGGDLSIFTCDPHEVSGYLPGDGCDGPCESQVLSGSAEVDFPTVEAYVDWALGSIGRSGDADLGRAIAEEATRLGATRGGSGEPRDPGITLAAGFHVITLRRGE